ncbi:hypothetical protein D3C87_1780760 [compost metagenome]
MIDAGLAAQGLIMEPVFSTNSIATLKAFTFLAKTIMFSSSAESNAHHLPADMIAILIADDTLKASVLQIVTMRGRRLPASVAAFLDFLNRSVE